MKLLCDQFGDDGFGMHRFMRFEAHDMSIGKAKIAPRAICLRRHGQAVLQERDVPAEIFLDEMEKRGIQIQSAIQ